MLFGQLTDRKSLRGTVVCLRSKGKRLGHLRFGTHISKSSLADANEKRDWRIYHNFAMILIKEARKLYADSSDFELNIDETVYALDSTIVKLCLSVFKWARFRKTTAAIKLHTLLDLRGNIPVFVHVTKALVHDVNVLDELEIESNSLYVLDRAYLSFLRLYRIHKKGAFFVIRAKKGLQFGRLYSRKVDKTTGLRCDQTIVLTGYKSARDYPEKLRRVKYYDTSTKRTYVFLTNHFDLSAEKVAQLYRYRWQIELFFKWIKQHLRIKVFRGHSVNAVLTQIWIAVCSYVLVMILKKRLDIDRSLYEILQILSVSQFERIPLVELFSEDQLQKLETLLQETLPLKDS